MNCILAYMYMDMFAHVSFICCNFSFHGIVLVNEKLDGGTMCLAQAAQAYNVLYQYMYRNTGMHSVQ
jgi:hypothetical protein